MEGKEAKARPLHVFTIPSTVEGDVREVGMVEITAQEEINAEKRARGDRTMIAVELAKESLRRVNGKPVLSSDGTVDSAWEAMVPKVRTFLVSAYSRMHIPTRTEEADFFSSMKVEV